MGSCSFDGDDARRFEVDFVWLLQAVMHKRAFKVKTTYPFPCMIFSLCRSAGVPIWNIDQLKTRLGTVDIGLIRYEANISSAQRGLELINVLDGHTCGPA